MGSESALFQQLEKLRRHCNQGSLQTRYRYYEGAKRFAAFAAEHFKLQKFANVKEKHLVAYVEHMQAKGLSASTIKTDLSAIRFYYDQSDGTNELPTNQAFSTLLETPLKQRKIGGVHRAWDESNVNDAKFLAIATGYPFIAQAISLAYIFGLRIHETIRLDRDHLIHAINYDRLTIKGKGGLIRDIPMNTEGRQLIDELLAETKQGKQFVPQDKKAHQIIKQIENWIYNYRDRFTSGDIDPPLTYHGLRHAYAQRRYTYHLAKLHDERKARLAVSIELGHGRDEVTRIYLS